jgi:protein TonB
MLDQLVESKNNSAENTRRSEFLLATMTICVIALLSAWTYSLFAKDYGMGSGDLDISSLVAPVALPEDAPPPKPPEDEPKKQDSNKPTVVEKILSMEDSLNKPPKLDEQRATKAPPIKAADMKYYNEGDQNQGRADTTKPPVAGDGLGDVKGDGDGKGDGLDDIKEVVKTPKPTEKPVPKVISGGVVNGKATNLVKPPYPAAARAVRASGAVNVQVTIDENGNVISASAVSGHPLLRAAAVQAARSSKFSPTLLSGQPVKVTGVIVYNFQP